MYFNWIYINPIENITWKEIMYNKVEVYFSILFNLKQTEVRNTFLITTIKSSDFMSTNLQ